MTALENTTPMQPVRVSHWKNLLWWLLLIAVVWAIHELPKYMASLAQPPASTDTTANSGREEEAFIALVFGKVSTTQALAIPAASFEAQLKALKQAGYSSVRLAQIQQWRQSDSASLAGKPILLTFEEANRETIEIADKLLLELGMTALVFVDTDLLDQGNISLVSWHKLELMAMSGRWEIGISGCPNSSDTFANPAMLAEHIMRQRERLEQRLQVPIRTADCARSWGTKQDDGAEIWVQGLQQAALQTGFIAAPFGANYRTDTEANLRRIRVSKSWSDADLLALLANHAPRRDAYMDSFASVQSASAWVVDTGDIAVADGQLKLFTGYGEKGALMTLGGTEKWQDADVAVQLDEQPVGQFWMSLRYAPKQPVLRLGVAQGQIMLQQYDDSSGSYRQIASKPAPKGKITLRLREVGRRAIAYLNGQALLARPFLLPESGLAHGTLALAVWDKTGGTQTATPSQASVQITNVSATPLFPRSGLLDTAVGNNAWQQLRQYSDELTAVSPHYFTWRNSKLRVLATNNVTLEMFARFHHLKFSPALFIAADTPLSDQPALSEQALKWSMNPAYDGINVVLDSGLVSDEWKVMLTNLGQQLNKADKTLTVTQLDNASQSLMTKGGDRLLLIAADTQLLTAGLTVQHPLSSQQQIP